MEVVLLWLFFAVLVANWARSRGRHFFNWFILAAIASPLIAAILLLILPSKISADGKKRGLIATMDGWTEAMKKKNEEIRAENLKEALRQVDEKDEQEKAELDDRIQTIISKHTTVASEHPAPVMRQQMSTAPSPSSPTFGKRGRS